METDASDNALAATLNQAGRPVAFFARTLQGPEIKHPAVEKEAQAIVEAVRYWRHYLYGQHFILKTDQKSVTYMFDKEHRGKIRNNKIERWRMELSCYSYEIIYRPGNTNIPADVLSRSCSAAFGGADNLKLLHINLCHPGVKRLSHFVRVKNLPYTVEEVRTVTRECPECAETKPRFYKPPTSAHLVKATQPFERLSVNFIGPLPSTNRNIYQIKIFIMCYSN